MTIGKVKLMKINENWIYKVIYGRTQAGTGVINSYNYNPEKQEFTAGNTLLFRGISKIIIN